MPWLISALGALLGSLLSNLVSKVLTLIGFGFVVYQGIKPLYDWLAREIQSQFGVGSPDAIPVLTWLGVLKIDVCISIVLSACLLRLLMMGLDAAGNVSQIKFGGR